MREIIRLLLEKVKSEALTVDEGVILLEAFIEQTQGNRDKTKGETKWDHFEDSFESKAKKFMWDLMDEENLNDWTELGDQFHRNIKKTLNDWLNKEST